MPIKILMPALSPTMQFGNLTKWLKQEGDSVEPGEVIAEIETDKAIMEVEAVDQGILAKILVQSGIKNVAVNSVIALLLEEGEDISSLATLQNDDEPRSNNPIALQVNPPLIANNQKSNTLERIKISPLAKRIANENDINFSDVTGTGPHNRIIKADILNTLSNKENTIKIEKRVNHPVKSESGSYKKVANSNIRQIIAKRLLESKQNIPHFYLSIECNLDKLLDVRSELNMLLTGNKLSINDFIVASSAKALLKVPEVNASWADEYINYYNNIDICVAVAIDGGLITPIIRDVAHKTIHNLSLEIKEIAQKAKENKLQPHEFQGGGFTISNLGMYGIKNFQAIINPPQSCILAIGTSNKRPIVIDDKITISTIMDVTLSCDHRVVDGVIGARFLAEFKKFIENPILILA